jgi:hypothetical protein
MNQGPIWGRFMKKTRGQKSRATVPLRDGGQWPAGEIKELHSMAHTPDIEPGGTWRQVTELWCGVGGGGGCWPQAGSPAAAAPYLAPCADPRLVEGEWGR